MIEGVFANWFETGLEGCEFILQDKTFINPDGFWSYQGIHVIRIGDYIEVFDGDKEIWKGTVEGQYSSGPFKGYYVHWLPTNIDLDLWYDIFFKRETTNPYTGFYKSKRSK